jgi:hypothetical protein
MKFRARIEDRKSRELNWQTTAVVDRPIHDDAATGVVAAHRPDRA